MIVPMENFRPTVCGIPICNRRALLLLNGASGKPHWGWFQGGVEPGETHDAALRREGVEELSRDFARHFGELICIGKSRDDRPIERDGRRYAGQEYSIYAVLLGDESTAYVERVHSQARAPFHQFSEACLACYADAMLMVSRRLRSGTGGAFKVLLVQRMLVELRDRGLIT